MRSRSERLPNANGVINAAELQLLLYLVQPRASFVFYKNSTRSFLDGSCRCNDGMMHVSLLP